MIQKLYILDKNEKQGEYNRQKSLADMIGKVYEELVEADREVTNITIFSRENQIFDLTQELMDIRTAVNSMLFNISLNYNIDMDMELQRHNTKLEGRGWVPAGYYDMEFVEVAKFE